MHKIIPLINLTSYLDALTSPSFYSKERCYRVPDCPLVYFENHSLTGFFGVEA